MDFSKDLSFGAAFAGCSLRGRWRLLFRRLLFRLGLSNFTICSSFFCSLRQFFLRCWVVLSSFFSSCSGSESLTLAGGSVVFFGLRLRSLPSYLTRFEEGCFLPSFCISCVSSMLERALFWAFGT
jgi:hypothetical protein